MAQQEGSTQMYMIGLPVKVVSAKGQEVTAGAVAIAAAVVLHWVHLSFSGVSILPTAP